MPTTLKKLQASTSASEDKVLDALRKLPDGELFDTKEIAEKLGRGVPWFRERALAPSFAGLSLLHKTSRYWGNPKTVAEAAKALRGGGR